MNRRGSGADNVSLNALNEVMRRMEAGEAPDDETMASLNEALDRLIGMISTQMEGETAVGEDVGEIDDADAILDEMLAAARSAAAGEADGGD